MVHVDGAYGEGGGQLVRTAVALAAITGRPTCVSAIRARRRNPGLAPQHVAAIRVVGELCGARIEGLTPGSSEIRFQSGILGNGRRDCEVAAAGSVNVDVGTAGSVTLVLQALLPVALCAGRDVAVDLVGGTDVRGAPPIDYLAHVLLPVLTGMGARLAIDVRRRGYYPRGGGKVRIRVEPSALRGLAAGVAPFHGDVRAWIHVANLPEHILDRASASLAARLSGRRLRIDRRLVTGDQAVGTGGAIVLAAAAQATVLGAAAVAERGVPAERLAERVASELTADLDSGATLDVHASDQILIFAALAEGKTEFRSRALSSHAQTTIWLLERFLPVRFGISEEEGLVRVGVVGIGGRSATAGLPRP